MLLVPRSKERGTCPILAKKLTVILSPKGVPSLPFLFTCLGKVRGINITHYLWVLAELKARAGRRYQGEPDDYVCVLIVLWEKRSG